jgi:hypothetical protein
VATQTDAERTGPTQPDGSKPMWDGGGVRAPQAPMSIRRAIGTSQELFLGPHKYVRL